MLFLSLSLITSFFLDLNNANAPSCSTLLCCSLTFWEQIDDGVQFTATRKFLTVIPVVLFLLALHGSEYQRQPLGINLLVVIIMVIAKTSTMHKVRILGINRN